MKTLAKFGAIKAPSEYFGMVPTWKTKKGETSKFVYAGGLRERRIGDLEWVDREGWRKKINLP